MPAELAPVAITPVSTDSCLFTSTRNSTPTSVLVFVGVAVVLHDAQCQGTLQLNITSSFKSLESSATHYQLKAKVRGQASHPALCRYSQHTIPCCQCCGQHHSHIVQAGHTHCSHILGTFAHMLLPSSNRLYSSPPPHGDCRAHCGPWRPRALATTVHASPSGGCTVQQRCTVLSALHSSSWGLLPRRCAGAEAPAVLAALRPVQSM